MDLILEDIHSKIYTIRGVQVMLDEDLAKLYKVETKVFNQAVKRNSERFPDNFRFLLTQNEYQEFEVTICDLKTTWRKKKFTLCFYRLQGVSMLSAVFEK
ncbi:MAG: ORF6N domain-containing protein [Aliarcobacter sp.]|nr:ORF6N domain-containing protein [Aliarcobacter sp.]